MTIEEIKNDKTELESAVRKLVSDFEEKHAPNGVYINSITAQFDYTGGTNGLPCTKNLKVVTNIDIQL